MKKIVLSVALLSAAIAAQAGGYLTNTNQSVLFLRNPAQTAVINVNGVYTNPAGVNFLENGFHLGINWQAAFQSREVTSTFGPFAYGAKNNGSSTKLFEATAKAPVIPSLQAAWVKDRLSLQFNFAVVGGGGKAEFEQGMGSFESQVALLGMLGKNQNLGFDQYDVNAYMRGKQFYYGVTLGAGYRLNDNWSGYLGLRGIYASSNYYGYLKDIRVNAGPSGTMVSAPGHFTAHSGGLAARAEQAKAAAEQAAAAAQQAAAAGDASAAAAAQAQAAQYAAAAQQAAAGARTFGVLAAATQDVLLNADQSAFGVAPILGIHFHSNKIDVAAKYEFGTRLEFTNQSANSASAGNLKALDAYKDGVKVRGDVPALFTLGVQYRPVESLRLNAGYHRYFDKQAKSGTASTGWKNELLKGGTSEYLLGVEYDINDRFEVSIGGQRTVYPNTDSYMNDLSFTVNSTSIGMGIGYRINERVKLNLAYFQTFYDDYTKTSNNYNNTANIIGVAQGEDKAKEIIASGALKGTDVFTRTNRVLGVGVEIKL